MTLLQRTYLLLALLVAPIVTLPAFAADASAAQQFRKVAGPNPTYPSQALKEGITGVVGLKVTTDAASRVTNVVVLDETPAGNEFGRHAIDVMKYWTFEPAAAGKTFVYRMTFRLR
jgi:TonB family protein